MALRELLPIVRNVEGVVTLREGNTPLYEMPRCAELAGVIGCWPSTRDESERIVQGHGNDCGPFGCSGAGYQWVACASTGNTSAAMAAYAARAGLRSIVFIPDGKIAWGKLSQAMDYGAMTCS